MILRKHVLNWFGSLFSQSLWLLILNIEMILASVLCWGTLSSFWTKRNSWCSLVIISALSYVRIPDGIPHWYATCFTFSCCINFIHDFSQVRRLKETMYIWSFLNNHGSFCSQSTKYSQELVKMVSKSVDDFWLPTLLLFRAVSWVVHCQVHILFVFYHKIIVT